MAEAQQPTPEQPRHPPPPPTIIEDEPPPPELPPSPGPIAVPPPPVLTPIEEPPPPQVPPSPPPIAVPPPPVLRPIIEPPPPEIPPSPPPRVAPPPPRDPDGRFVARRPPPPERPPRAPVPREDRRREAISDLIRRGLARTPQTAIEPGTGRVMEGAPVEVDIVAAIQAGQRELLIAAGFTPAAIDRAMAEFQRQQALRFAGEEGRAQALQQLQQMGFAEVDERGRPVITDVLGAVAAGQRNTILAAGVTVEALNQAIDESRRQRVDILRAQRVARSQAGVQAQLASEQQRQEALTQVDSEIGQAQAQIGALPRVPVPAVGPGVGLRPSDPQEVGIQRRLEVLRAIKAELDRGNLPGDVAKDLVADIPQGTTEQDIREAKRNLGSVLQVVGMFAAPAGIAGTALTWDADPGWQRAMNVSTDMLSILPIIGMASNLSRAGVRGGDMAARLAFAELVAPVEAISNPIRALRKGLDPIETALIPQKLPINALEVSTHTIRIPAEPGFLRTSATVPVPEHVLRGLDPAEVMGARDIIAGRLIAGDPGIAPIGPAGTVQIRGAGLQRAVGPAAVHATPDLRNFMLGAKVEGGSEQLGLFVAPSMHSRFVASSATGAVEALSDPVKTAVAAGQLPDKAIPGVILIRDPEILARMGGSGKMYRSAVEIERVLPPGTELPPVRQMLHTRDAAGNRITIGIVGEPLTPREIAALKFVGAQDTITNIVRPVGEFDPTVARQLDEAVDLGRQAERLAEQAATARAAGRADEAADLTQQAERIGRRSSELLTASQGGEITRMARTAKPVAIYTGDQPIRESLEAMRADPSVEVANTHDALIEGLERRRALNPNAEFTAIPRGAARQFAEIPEVATRVPRVPPGQRTPAQRTAELAAEGRIPSVSLPTGPSRVETIIPTQTDVPRVPTEILRVPGEPPIAPVGIPRVAPDDDEARIRVPSDVDIPRVRVPTDAPRIRVPPPAPDAPRLLAADRVVRPSRPARVDREAPEEEPPRERNLRIAGVQRGAVGDTAIDMVTGEAQTVKDIGAVPNVPTKKSFTPLQFNRAQPSPQRIPWGALDLIISPDGSQQFVKARRRRARM